MAAHQQLRACAMSNKCLGCMQVKEWQLGVDAQLGYAECWVCLLACIRAGDTPPSSVRMETCRLSLLQCHMSLTCCTCCATQPALTASLHILLPHADTVITLL
jgi:hypothetical protein